MKRLVSATSQQVEKAKQLFRRIEPRLLRDYRGQVIAIELESGAYLLGDDELEVARRARAQFPGKAFYFFRIGEPVVHKLR
jgi:hypothetical protein